MRVNRRQGQFRLPPSTRARWGWKLRLVDWLNRYYPIVVFVVEDIRAVTQAGKRRWNASFSPLEVGKQWFNPNWASERRFARWPGTKQPNSGRPLA